MNSKLNASVVPSRSPLTFILLVFVLSIPFWVFGGLTGFELLPGLPMSALMTFCPLMAASMLVYRENHFPGVTQLLKRAFDCKRIQVKVWYAPILFMMPSIGALSYALMRWLGWPMPPWQVSASAAVILFMTFFLSALGEELGWFGYLLDPFNCDGMRSKPVSSSASYGRHGTSSLSCKLTVP